MAFQKTFEDYRAEMAFVRLERCAWYFKREYSYEAVQSIIDCYTFPFYKQEMS